MLYTDLYQLTMSQGYYRTGLYKKEAHFDFFFRTTPFDSGFVIFAGLADLLDKLSSLHLAYEESEWLQKQGFDKSFCHFLQNFRFEGDIISVPEGEVVFANEPILTVSGPLLGCQLAETVLLNTLNFQSLVATKARRIKMACGERKVIDFGLRRGQGEGALAASRAAAIGGIDATSNVQCGFRYGIPVSGTMAHSWVQAFGSELEAFQAYSRIFPDNSILLVDTYDTIRSGIPNAIRVAKKLEQDGHRLAGIRLDSGDHSTLSHQARALLDEAGLDYVPIFISDQLDEHRILDLVSSGAPVDGFGVGTRLITGHPDGSLSGVYKMCSLDGKPNMKQTEETSKRNLPGIKELYRETDAGGYFRRDHILLEDPFTHPDREFSKKTENMTPVSTESHSKTENRHRLAPIRSRVMQSGRIMDTRKDLAEMAKYSKQRVSKLPERFKRFDDPDCYEVTWDDKLEILIQKLNKGTL